MQDQDKMRRVYLGTKAAIVKLEKKSRDYFSAKGADIYTRFVRRMFFMFLAACVVAGVVSLLVLLIASIAKPVTKVPAVVGINVIDAAIQIQEKGLQVEIDSKFDTNTIKYTVLDQYPKKGVTVRKGRTVTLLVSMGKDVYTVPNVTGQKREKAEALLAQLNIGYEITVIQSADYPVDTVIGQDLAAGKEVERTARMKLLVNSDVSAGQFKVGDYIHQPVENAVKTLIANSMQPVIDKMATKNQDEDGMILSQSIPKDSVIAKNSEIRFQVGVYGEDDAERQAANYHIFTYTLAVLDPNSTNDTQSSAQSGTPNNQSVVRILLSDSRVSQQEIFNKTMLYGESTVLVFKSHGPSKLSLIVNNNFIREIPYE